MITTSTIGLILILNTTIVLANSAVFMIFGSQVMRREMKEFNKRS